MPLDQRQIADIANLLTLTPPNTAGPIMSDASPYPVMPGQQYAANASTQLGPVRAVDNLRRAMGVGPTMTGVKATDDVLKLIDEALQLAPGTKPK